MFLDNFDRHILDLMQSDASLSVGDIADRVALSKTACWRRIQKLEKAGVMIALAADHTTDSNCGAHTADPVPALLYDPALPGGGIPPEPVNFGEKACSNGTMPRQSSYEFLLRLLDKMA